MDKRLKQRLLGAAVIVALAVIFVPELVKQTPTQGPQEVSQEIPPRPAALAEIPKGDIKLPSELSAPQGGAVAGNEQQVQVAGQSLSSPSIPMTDDVPAGNENPDDQDALDADEQRRQQQAALEEQQKIQQIKEREERRRLERQRAEEAARQLALADPVEPKTSKKPPAKPANKQPTAKTDSAKPQASKKITTAKAETGKAQPALPKLTLISPSLYQEKKPAKSSPNRWIVQAGSFADSQNAKLLRERLRTLQFQVSMNQATVNGQKLYRVQLGPHGSRAESERIRDRLLREAGIPGSVVPVYN